MRSQAEVSPSFVFAPELGEPGSSLTLSAAESHYLTRVCRARLGDRATATDGRGRTASLILTSVRGRVTAEIERTEGHRRPRRAWVCCGSPEGARADWLVEKLAELGVERWQPLECERSEWRSGAGRLNRWERLAVAGMRQSRRPYLMEVRGPLGIAAALEQLPEGGARWVASQRAERVKADPAGALAVGAIGPAAGFTPAEEATFGASGFRPLLLSDGRLSTETAALAWAVWWSLGWE